MIFDAAAIQAGATVVLVGVTVLYVVLTNHTANAARESAEATRKLAESTEEMKVASVQPLVILDDRYHTVSQHGMVKQSFPTLVNIGIGPALDVAYHIGDPEDLQGTRFGEIMRFNTGHAIGTGLDNSVVLSTEMGEKYAVRKLLRERKGSFLAEYADVYGKLYETRTEGECTTTKSIHKRTLDFLPKGASKEPPPQAHTPPASDSSL